ncbi:hypothetical protein [Lentzea sp. NPDC003310]
MNEPERFPRLTSALRILAATRRVIVEITALLVAVTALVATAVNVWPW